MKGNNRIGKGMMAAACALSLAFFGCSSKSKSPASVVKPPEGNNPGTVVNALDSLVNLNKGKGKGVVTGFLTGEGKSIASGLLKQASNAAGERRLLTHSELPLTGATVLIFNALKPTTFADTSVTTDAKGNYTAVLDEGVYFAFAVYLDLSTFTLVTTSIPNIQLKKDEYVKMDTATAIEDETAPTVTGVYDAGSANSDGIFLVGSVPATKAKINITFSEPMNRESAKGVVLGSVDTSSGSSGVSLADTVAGVLMSWSGDSKQLTLFVPEMAVGKQYAIIMPVSLKDLAKNPLASEAKATFVTVKAEEIAALPFSVNASSPADGESIKPVQNPSLTFSRPVDVFSILKNASIEPKVDGYWEVSGARATFIHKNPLAVGQKYVVTVPVDVKDLGGQALDKAFSLNFTVKDYEGAAKDNTGDGKAVALTVETAFDAYLAGDVGRFATYFHPNFRMYDGEGTKSKTEFLDMIRQDVAQQQSIAGGFMGPVFSSDSAACASGGGRWKVAAKGDASGDYLWVDAFVGPGQSPRAFDKDGKEISRTELKWDPTGPRFTYKEKVYGFAPDFSAFNSAVNMDGARNDLRFMGDMLMKTSTVVLAPVKLEAKTEFNVDPNVLLSGDTAKLAVKMIDYQKFNRIDFRDQNQACHGSLADTSYQILKFVLVKDGSGKWSVLMIVSDKEKRNKDNFDTKVTADDFKVQQVLPIKLVSPINGIDKAAIDKSGAYTGKVAFTFTGVKSDSIGGYVVGLAEDGKFCIGRPPYGALYFVKASKKDGSEETFSINSAAGAESDNATGISRRVQDLRLPGWERTQFEFALAKLVSQDSGFAGVYNWKVTGVKDTSASQFLGNCANGFQMTRFVGESDFGGTRGYFAVKAYPSAAFFNQAPVQPPTGGVNGPMSYGDMDQDGVPDQMEMKYKTDPRDRNSFPDFRVDTDGDKLADFLEAMLDKTGADSLIDKKGSAEEIKVEIDKLRALGLVWEDSDGDGFPDDIEMMQGYNPRDPNNNPGSRARAQAPIGVFAGKIQIGSLMHTVSFKLYTDSTKKLMVTYTAIIDKDTVIDTARAAFNELMGEIQVAVKLPLNGPDSGRALLLRGRYDAFQSLIQGGVERIPAPANNVDNFGGGMWVGQFAASGRGEDVSRFFGNNSGPSNPGTVTNMPPPTMAYRMPPSGVKEGGKIVLTEDGSVIFINEFQDTLAVVEKAMFRSQPDGSMGFNADKDVQLANGVHKHFHVDGRTMMVADAWIIDGGFFVDQDSAGMHRGIPGQYCGKASATKVAKNATGGLNGVWEGWVAQDLQGTGFTGTPTTNNPPPCDPSKGPCTTNPNPCPAGTVCNQPPPPSFSKDYMAGRARYVEALKSHGAVEGEYFYVQMAGRVFRVKLDSVGVSEAKMPMCGHVIIKPELIPLKDGAGDIEVRGHQMDSASLPTGQYTYVIGTEDQYMPGMPALVLKAFDSQGEVRANVWMVDMRQFPGDYGTQGSCQPITGNPPPPNNGPARYQGPIDAVKAALAASGNQVAMAKDSAGTLSPMTVDGATVSQDPANLWVSVSAPSLAVKVMFLADPSDAKKLMIQNNLPVVFNPNGTQPNQNPPPPTSLVWFAGTQDDVKGAFSAHGTTVTVLRGDGSTEKTAAIDVSSLQYNDLKKAMTVKEAGGTQVFVVLGVKDNSKVVLVVDSHVAVAFFGSTSTNPPPPVDSTSVNNVVFYKGGASAVMGALSNSQNKAQEILPDGKMAAQVSLNGETIRMDSARGIVVVNEIGTAGRIFAFVGDKANPMQMVMTNNLPSVTKIGDFGGAQQPPPPGEGPTLYKGTLEALNILLTSKVYVVVIMSPNGPAGTGKVAGGSVRTDGDLTVGTDANNAANIFVFFGDKADPTKVALDAGGNIMVGIKPTTAGP